MNAIAEYALPAAQITEHLHRQSVEQRVVERRHNAAAFPPEDVPCQGTKNAGGKISGIVHVDVDAFFASVEQVLDPRLRGRPVLVGRGVVASASYEAKFRGVRTAMSFREALRICPKAAVVPGQYEHYADFAERVRRILESYTPAVETAALDDFYLDFAGTERLYPDYEAALRRLQAEIRARTGLSVSVGAARTKVVASIASRLQRPRGFRIVQPGEEDAFLAPLPVDKLHGVGHVHAGARARAGWARGAAALDAKIGFARNHHRGRHY